MRSFSFKNSFMKKKVLFIIGTLQSGGVSKSMVSLLNAWDRTKYDTTLLLCCKAGDVFSQFVPKDVRVIYDPVMENVMGGFGSAKWLLQHGHPLLALGVFIRLVLSRISRSWSGWLISRMMPVVSNEEYDLIVDYGGQQILYYMIDKLKGKKKVTFFHNDYSKWPYYYSMDKRYYPKVDRIYSISRICVDALKRYFPDCESKIGLMENISSPALIQRQSEEALPKSVSDTLKQHQLVLASLGHFIRRKGADFSITAAKILAEQGIDFIWLIIGQTPEKDLLADIHRKGLDNCFLLVGVQPNPYPYLRAADIYVHPSRFEGKSIALDEAKILCKPIVVTNFSTVHDQFEDGVNASICEMDGTDLANKILSLYKNMTKRDCYISYLKNHIQDNTKEVEKLYQLLEP